MMQKRTIYSLLLISFIAVFAASMAFANQVTFETKSIPRCVNQSGSISAIVSSDSVSAIEVVVEISGDATGPITFTWDPTLYARAGWTFVVDDTSGVDGTLPDTFRVAAILTDPTQGALAAGTYAVGKLNFKSNDLCQGAINLAGADFTYPIPAVVTTQFVDAATSAILPVVVNAGVISIVDQAPALAAIPNATLHFGQTYTGTAVGSDPDQANGCETLTYGKVSGPAALTVNSTTGAISWLTTGPFVCDNPITVKVTDKCGLIAEKSFVITVTNTPPVITCTNPAPVVLGDTVFGAVTAVDPDLGPYPLLYKVVSFSGPGTLTLNPTSGAFYWPTVNFNSAYLGTFTLVVSVTDSANVCAGSPSNADTCSVTITVVWGTVVIDKIHNQLQGQYTDVGIKLGTNYPIGGFNLLVGYDNSALALQQVDPGAFITDCGWEYFTYRFGANGNCGSGCPTGYVRIVGIAESNNGNHHPACFTTFPGPEKYAAKMRFLVSNDRTLNCQFVPVFFWWNKCDDNTFSNVKGDSLILSHDVYNYGGFNQLYYIYTNLAAELPTAQGAPATCDVHNVPDKPDTWRVIDFYNGGVDIVCSDSIDARGDINLNKWPNEIADAVMFTNYFVYGLPAFGTHVQGSIAASDVNADGYTLTVADLVYLIRIIVGDVSAVPKLSSPNVNLAVSDGIYSVPDGMEMGAVAMVVKGNQTPINKTTNMDMKYAFDGANTHIVMVPQYEGKTSISGFSGEFIQVSGELVSIDMATILGQTVNAKPVPKDYALNQNYPNPFNPTTTLSFALPVAGNYTLTIYNVNGQIVKTFARTAEAGFQSVEWNASGVASGVYFYKLDAGSFSATKKMVLLK